MLVVYFYDILLTGSDGDGIKKAKEYLKNQFVTKYMGRPRHFLEIEIAHSKNRAVFSQKKSMLWIYYKRLDYLVASQCVLPIKTDAYLSDETGPVLEDISQYKTCK